MNVWVRRFNFVSAKRWAAAAPSCAGTWAADTWEEEGGGGGESLGVGEVENPGVGGGVGNPGVDSTEVGGWVDSRREGRGAGEGAAFCWGGVGGAS